MKLSEELTWRGFAYQTTYSDISELDTQPINFYWGVDPSADSMTIGHLAAAMMVRHFISHGHKAFLLVGGATGMIGDPDGKKQERDLKNLQEINSNIEGITNQYRSIFAGNDFEIVNNADWFKNMGYLDFLRNIGKHMPMTQLIDREFVKSRVGQGGSGISYAEFSYSLIQGYDFLHLFREKGVTLQVCGADQWGNSLSGVEMIRKLEGASAHVYSFPLVINKTTGVKFGKSEEGAIWLDSSKTSVFQFYQFWLNVDDEGVGDYLKTYTLIELIEYEKLMAEFRANPNDRTAQKYLAFEVTKIVHGEAAAKSAKKVTETLFGITHVSELNNDDLVLLSHEIPTIPIGASLIDALVQSQIASSNGEARRLIENGAISINNERVTSDQIINKISFIKKGKNSFILIK